jgi:hypothetical protein
MGSDLKAERGRVVGCPKSGHANRLGHARILKMKRKQPAISAVLGMVLFSAAFAGFAYLIVRAAVLKFDGAAVSARVIETTESPRGMRSINSNYAVQYQFQLPGSNRWYMHQELMLTGRPVAEVTKSTWVEAKRTGLIRVIYWRHDPNVNLPAEPYALNGILCPSIGGIICALLAVSCGHTLAKRIRSKHETRSTRQHDPLMS